MIQVSAADIMTADPVTIKANADIKDRLKIFRETKYKTIPVLDDKDKLTGIVSVVDVIRKMEM